MAKYYVGQEVCFVSQVFTPTGRKLCPIAGQSIIWTVIDSIQTTEYGTFYTFEGLTYRLPESEVFKTEAEAKQYIEDEELEEEE